MKNTALTLLAGLAFATAAQAGPVSAPYVPAAPAPSCLWTWFAGGSYGQIDGDWDEDIYTLHVGIERTCAGNPCGSHAFYLEVGYTEKDETYNGIQQFSTDFDYEIIPITLNYKYECALTGKLNWYVGAGAGVALYDIEASQGPQRTSDDDVVFYGHIFAGLVYNVSESFEIFVGARYIVMDDPDVFGGVLNSTGLVVTPDGDIQYELGARFNF